MRKTVFLAIGFLETAVATVLACVGFQLPSQSDVEQNFHRVEKVTAQSGTQVRLLRDQVHDLRRPELQRLAGQLRTQTQIVTVNLKGQAVDFDQVQTVSTALGDVAEGLDQFGDTLDVEAVGKLGEGLNTTADFLDKDVAPTAAKAADELDKTTAELEADANRLAALLRQTPPDLKAAREIHDGLARFSEGLERIDKRLKPQRLDAMREGFRGLDSSLTTGAEQVERLSRYSYPHVTMNGLKPYVEQRKFWPEGDKIADGLRKAADGVREAGKELDDLAEDLPQFQSSLDESRKIADRTREALGTALKQQDKLEALFKDVPERSARLAEQLPKMSRELSKVLRETQRLKEVAALLRQAQKGVDTAVERWPELRKTLSRSADLLRETQRQLRHALENRQEYESAMKQTVVLADAYSSLLPLFTQRLEAQLQEQEAALDDLGQSIHEVDTALPPVMESTVNLMWTARLLVWLVAAIVGLHGIYLTLSVRLGQAYSI
jgi:methyl-accepting chemotaxis protein